MARTFLFKFLKTFIIDINLNLNFETVSNHRKVNNSNRGDVAPLARDYCSLIIRASQFSSTTRNLVPRFKRWSKGGSCGCEILMDLLGLGCSPRRGRSITLMSPFLCFKSPWKKMKEIRLRFTLRLRRGAPCLASPLLPTPIRPWG